MNITERQEEILNRIVEDYIDSAQPISSEFLEKKHKFSVSPATIRIEMKKLTDEGFLFQPHPSSGRVPTDKGYRFFVDDLLKKEIPDFDSFLELEMEELLKGAREDIFKLASHLTKFLSQTSSNFAILHIAERDFFLKEGWEEILKEPEFKEQKFISNFTNFLKNLEENIEVLKINSGINIHIGKENPFPKADEFSIISSKCYFPNEEGTISLLGPKRMDYATNISLMNSLTKLLEEL